MSIAETRNRYLEGTYAPVQEEVTAFDLPVVGTLPRRARRALPAQRAQPGLPAGPGPLPLVRR